MEINSAFLSSGNSGDTLAALPAMREFYNKTGIKPTLYLRKGVKAHYYEGAVHPVKDESGSTVMLNEAMIKMLTPLLKVQPFLEDVKEWTDEEIGCDLDLIRETNVGMPGLSINRWYFYVYPDLACDLSKPWLTVPDSDMDLAKDKIIITRTERYLNHSIDYSFLKPYEDELIFSGTMREYNNFCMSFDLNIKKLTVPNFLTLAQAIKQSRFHITNQTMANQISTGLMQPSILEVCTYAPNCIPIGENRYDFLAQGGLEYYFHKLYGDLDSYMAKIKAAQLSGQ
jgi:hypothetical protein